jgi:hypothetical protein
MLVLLALCASEGESARPCSIRRVDSAELHAASITTSIAPNTMVTESEMRFMRAAYLKFGE